MGQVCILSNLPGGLPVDVLERSLSFTIVIYLFRSLIVLGVLPLFPTGLLYSGCSCLRCGLCCTTCLTRCCCWTTMVITGGTVTEPTTNQPILMAPVQLLSSNAAALLEATSEDGRQTHLVACKEMIQQITATQRYSLPRQHNSGFLLLTLSPPSHASSIREYHTSSSSPSQCFRKWPDRGRIRVQIAWRHRIILLPRRRRLQ